MKLRKKKRREFEAATDEGEQIRSRKKKRRDLQEGDLVKKKRKRKSPLKFLLGVMNDPDTPKMQRIKCALAALPYCHKAKNKIAKGPVGRPAAVVPEGELPLRKRKLGKKESKLVDAQNAASTGRFKPLSPPHFSGMNGVSH